MRDLQPLVAAFHKKFNHPCFDSVNVSTLFDPTVASLRLRLLAEEVEEGEAAEAALNDFELDEVSRAAAAIEIFDALLDIAVLTLGTACVYGLKLESREPSQEKLQGLAGEPELFQPIRDDLRKLEFMLDTLNRHPRTQSYLVSEIAHELQNLLDSCIGTALEIDFPFEAGFIEVMNSNMSKLGADGEPIYREDGKILKGPNYFKPDLEKVLYEHWGKDFESVKHIVEASEQAADAAVS